MKKYTLFCYFVGVIFISIGSIGLTILAFTVSIEKGLTVMLILGFSLIMASCLKYLIFDT